MHGHMNIKRNWIKRDQLDVTCFIISLFTAQHVSDVNLLTPNVNYSGRTASLTSKVAFYIFIQQI